MKTAFIDASGATQNVELTDAMVMEAVKSGNPVAHFNRQFPDANSAYGTAFDQFKISAGLVRADGPNPMGIKSSSIGAVLEGQAGISAASTQQNITPFGTASRAFVAISIIDEITSELQKERETDTVVFNDMVATDISIATEHFEQPVVDYTGKNGPEKTKATRVAQGAEPANMLFFRTSDRIRRIGAWNIGMTWTDQALRNTTIDYVARTSAHFLEVERDERVYNYLSSLFAGDLDFNIGAVSSVASSALDVASTGGVLTHKAWVKFLARNRKYRRITHAAMDIDTYLKVEGRTGRPGTTNYDPTLARIDPQGVAQNVSFGGDVKIFLVDPATDGGPIPANTIWALDSSIAVSRVTNTAAAYSAVEEFAMKRVTSLRMDWAEEVFRSLGDTELRPFDVLTITP